LEEREWRGTLLGFAVLRYSPRLLDAFFFFNILDGIKNYPPSSSTFSDAFSSFPLEKGKLFLVNNQPRREWMLLILLTLSKSKITNS